MIKDTSFGNFDSALSVSVISNSGAKFTQITHKLCECFKNQPMKITTWFSGSDVTRRHYLMSKGPEETIEFQATNKIHLIKGNF